MTPGGGDGGTFKVAVMLSSGVVTNRVWVAVGAGITLKTAVPWDAGAESEYTKRTTNTIKQNMMNAISKAPAITLRLTKNRILSI
jgi:hypothetical protein